MSDSFDTMISGYLDESLTAELMSELENWINDDPANAKRFTDAVYLEERLGAEMRLRQFTDSNTADDKVISFQKGKRKTWGREIAAMAAGLVLLAGLVFWWQLESLTTPRANFALVVQVKEAKWAEGFELSVGDKVSSGVLRLEGGIVHLEFTSGVEVTLRGPAEFEITSLEETRLHAGVLACTVPPGAEGFRVDTRTAQVIDLGTAFGIEQFENGSSEVSVFDGEVEIVTDDDSDKHLLTEGKTVQLGPDGRLSEVEFTTETFEKLWPATSGIAGSTGDFRIAPPWPRRLRLIESDTEILVVSEGYAGELEKPCPIDRVGVEGAENTIPAGQRVRSYLLQFNPTNDESAPRGENVRRIEGSITFARPVLGLITRSDTLEESDAVFASRPFRGPNLKRGLEGSPSAIADEITLSEDRRTVTLSLVTSGRFNDHVRVIVDSQLGDPGVSEK